MTLFVATVTSEDLSASRLCLTTFTLHLIRGTHNLLRPAIVELDLRGNQ